MKGSNSLTSHHGESTNRRSDKMASGGAIYKCKKSGLNKFLKRRYNKKCRQFLKNLTFDKI